MKKIAFMLILMFGGAGTANALSITDTVIDPAGSGFSGASWSHSFDVSDFASITSATIEITHSYYGFYEFEAVPDDGLYADGSFLGALTDCDADNDGEADIDGSCALIDPISGTITDTFVVTSLSDLLDGGLDMFISADPRDFWFASESVLTIKGIPEPAILSLMGLGLVGIGFARRRRQS